MSIPPVLAIAGIQATARVVESAIGSLHQTFQSLLDRSERAIAEGDQVGHRAAKLTVEPQAGSRVAAWANQQAVRHRLQQIGTQVAEALEEAGLSFDRPVDIRWSDGRLEVQAPGHQAPSQVESHLLAHPDLATALADVANLLGLTDQPLHVRFHPDGSFSSPSLSPFR